MLEITTNHNRDTKTDMTELTKNIDLQEVSIFHPEFDSVIGEQKFCDVCRRPLVTFGQLVNYGGGEIGWLTCQMGFHQATDALVHLDCVDRFVRRFPQILNERN